VDRRKEDMKVLVTGADGFIGSHLTESLLAEGYDVRALAQYNSFNYWGWLEDIQQTSNLVHEFAQIVWELRRFI
jgi:nucleoside-diphosphate-sugar epimerase